VMNPAEHIIKKKLEFSVERVNGAGDADRFDLIIPPMDVAGCD